MICSLCFSACLRDQMMVERKQNALAGTPAAKSVAGGDVSAHGRVFRNAVHKDNSYFLDPVKRLTMLHYKSWLSCITAQV